MNKIQGIHHITAMASDPQKNIDFYAQVLGQRFVKRTVNFDDPGTYHLYYGDEVGSPGTIMTFFPFQANGRSIKKGRRGNGEVLASAYNILPASVDWWRARLNRLEIVFTEAERFGETVLIFPDPDGMLIELVPHDGVPAPAHWADGPIPAEHALRGFHSVTLGVDDEEGTAPLLVQGFGYTRVGQDKSRVRFAGAGQFGQFVDLLVRPGYPRGWLGAGSVHHVAFRTIDDTEQIEYQSMLRSQGYMATEVKDRQYFHSIYFREPNGTLFEVATDAPGFLYDEPIEELGQNLKLPAWLERNRAEIEKRLPEIEIK